MTAPAWISKGFNLPALQRSRLHWVDYLKGIAIILVVYRHILIGMDRSAGFEIPTYLFNANNIFFSFRMPLFFILSGVFLAGSLKKRAPGTLLLQKFENLFYPYLIWATIQITLQIVMEHFHLTNADRGWRDYLYIFYQPRNLDQFWYLPALFNTTMVYIFTKAKLRLPIWTQLFLGVLLYFTSKLPGADRYSMLSDWMEFYIFFALGDALHKAFFDERFTSVFRNPWTLVAITPVFVLTQVYYLYWLLPTDQTLLEPRMLASAEFLGISLTGCATMLCVAFLLERFNVANWLRIFGYHSLYIYVIHVMVAAFIRAIMVHVLHVHQVHVMLFTGICCGITIPVLFYNYFVLDGPLWWLFYFRKSSMYEKEKKSPQTPPPVGVTAG